MNIENVIVDMSKQTLHCTVDGVEMKITDPETLHAVFDTTLRLYNAYSDLGLNSAMVEALKEERSLLAILDTLA